MEFNLQRGTMGTFHHTEWYEKPQTLWMGSERGNKINKLVSQSDPEYRWQEPQWRASLHFSTFSFFSQSLISASVLFIVSQGTCSLLTRTCLNIQRYDPQTEWGLLKGEGGASVFVCCPPIVQACRWFAWGASDSLTCSTEKEMNLFIHQELIGWWVATRLAACRPSKRFWA